ncbi:hypothetical protein [Paludisphaera borealis]|uniref:Uncharacterized protein n=1 Tax=Paludisphaera borealis TaxID=1387353 RepID=A0A1U7CX93_9BACT|nr:hypothetical protein [Paludisphaera borealis]APW63555.1 hypothetical protein BSF38_05127 [Paludisphaera borealis]
MTVAIRIQLLTAGLMLFISSGALAQSPGGGGQGFTGSYGPGMESLLRSGGAGYLPSGSGFLPYTPGPGGGLGVQSRMSAGSPATSSGAMSMPAAAAGLGTASRGLSPLTPIGGMGGGRGGMGSGRLLNRMPAGRGMVRPPVGAYPFRVPPSLLGPATQAPAMAM